MHVWITKHAHDRMQEMGITRNEVFDLLRNPDVTRPSKSGRTEANTAVADRYRWAAVYRIEDDTFILITLIWRTYDQYDRAGLDFVAEGAS